jgi:hypothetical protein
MFIIEINGSNDVAEGNATTPFPGQRMCRHRSRFLGDASCVVEIRTPKE